VVNCMGGCDIPTVSIYLQSVSIYLQSVTMGMCYVDLLGDCNCMGDFDDLQGVCNCMSG
jgi:hypothetical protein